MGAAAGRVSLSIKNGGSADVGLFEASIERPRRVVTKGDDRPVGAAGRGPGASRDDARRRKAIFGLR